MKFVTPLIVVKDLQVARKFYEDVLSQHMTLDLGDNVALEGIALQVNYDRLVGAGDLPITYRSNDHELYFEETDFDGFLAHLERFSDIVYLHPAKEYPWGQRVVRFYDPDGHIIEVGEAMETVFRRFFQSGLTAQQVAERTAHPLDFVKQFAPA